MSSDTTSEPPVPRPDPMGSDAEEHNLSPLCLPELHSLHYQEQYPQFRRRGGHPPGWPRIATSPATARACSSTPGGGHPPGWPRIATPIQRGAPDRSPWWRPSSGVAEDRNIHSRGPTAMSPWGGGGHPPGWPRIATRTTRTPATTTGSVAAILRGGRGSQPVQFGGEILPRGRWRPSSGVAEDRNRLHGRWSRCRCRRVAAILRGGRGSQLPVRAGHPRCQLRVAAILRGGRGSQRVQRRRRLGARPSVAAILRGGRGSQHHQVLLLQEHHQVAAILRGGRGSQPVPLNPPSTRRAGRGGHPPGWPRIATRLSAVLHARLRDRGGGHPPGWPRIATVICLRLRRRMSRVAAILRGGRGSQHLLHDAVVHRRAGWRPSSGVAEDRNYSVARVVRRRHAVAAILRGGRGSQHRSRRDRRHSRLPGGGHPPGWPRIATRLAVAAGRSSATSGGHPPGWPRIATRTCPAGHARQVGGGHPPGWPRIATPIQASPHRRARRVAAILRGGRGSQQFLPRGRSTGGPSGGHPPGWPRIATCTRAAVPAAH